MGNLSLPVSSGVGVINFGMAPPASKSAQAMSSGMSRDCLIDVLRQAAVTGSLSADAILGAAADAARVLSGADGTAIASRNNGVIVCRARSGAMAPGLGAPVNSNSGISGECLRTASIQLCSDTSTDARVDSEICRALGIRSIAVVPLLGRMGMFGILEAFSARVNAFEKEEVDSLRSLAEIAEIAYERERSTANAAPATSSVRAARFPVAARVDGDPDRARFFPKRYWIFGAIFVVLLAMAWIARISWRQTGVEIAASASAAQKPFLPASTSAQPVTSGKPKAAIPAYPIARTRTRLAENAGVIDRLSDSPAPVTPSKNLSSDYASTKNLRPAGADTSQSAPAVAAAVSGLHGEMPELASERGPLPQFGGIVSRGAVPATAVRRVSPIYPLEARSHGIAGDVILDATISRNGSVRQVTVVSGPASLTDAAVAAVRQWRFSPALLNGTPVQVQQRITIAFRLP